MEVEIGADTSIFKALWAVILVFSKCNHLVGQELSMWVKVWFLTFSAAESQWRTCVTTHTFDPHSSSRAESLCTYIINPVPQILMHLQLKKECQCALQHVSLGKKHPLCISVHITAPSVLQILPRETAPLPPPLSLQAEVHILLLRLLLMNAHALYKPFAKCA